MKKQEIVITDKTIVLGIFETRNFGYFCDKCICYDGFSRLSLESENDYRDRQFRGLIGVVERAAIYADKIIFILDDVRFPINIEQSITCHELKLICENEELFNKTVFVKGDNVINFDKNIL